MNTIGRGTMIDDYKELLKKLMAFFISWDGAYFLDHIDRPEHGFTEIEVKEINALYEEYRRGNKL